MTERNLAKGASRSGWIWEGKEGEMVRRRGKGSRKRHSCDSVDKNERKRKRIEKRWETVEGRSRRSREEDEVEENEEEKEKEEEEEEE
uniref:Uncharacterized protein n=1 Tax=Vespula pensylvanica TaxID=30213 RepID=A0A834KH74_VESPE|nr:hypothetical protein H0235_014342 [Vespula pensylvanica]